MRSAGEIEDGALELAAVDVTLMPDDTVKAEILALVRTINICYAALWRRVASFDRRDLAKTDGQRNTRAWLRAFGNLSFYTSGTTVARAELLEQLPVVAAAVQHGRISADHVSRLVTLADEVGVEPIHRVEDILADTADRFTPEELEKACQRVRAHANPDGAEPDPDAVQARRGLTLSRSGDMVRVRGQVDPEAGATIMAALDAIMLPPGPDDTRTAAQRRADALVELCRLPLNYDLLPQTGGNGPQVGLLISPEALARQAQQDGATVPDWIANMARYTPAHDDTDTDTDTGTDDDDAAKQDCADDADHNAGTTARNGSDAGRPPGGNWPPPAWGTGTDPLTAAGIPRLDKGWLTWVGDIPTATAQRLSCDSILYRILYDPATGQPLDVGRAYRTAPHWIRRALHARDRGCRWPGCMAPIPWTDAHHLTWWTSGNGQTRADDMLSLCRFHHVQVHEGHWTIQMHPHTGEVRVIRPNGQPYELEPTPSWLRGTG